jgi:hypothetical protein
MHQVRRYLRALAATALVLVSALGGWSILAHGLECHDHDGAPVVVVHDASAHAFRSTAPSESERTVHCVLCHWTRLHGPSVETVAAAPAVVSRAVPMAWADIAIARLIAAAQPPLRAPPALSVLSVLA